MLLERGADIDLMTDSGTSAILSMSEPKALAPLPANTPTISKGTLFTSR